MDRSFSIKIVAIILIVIVNIIALICAFGSIYTTAKRVISSANTEDNIGDFEHGEIIDDPGKGDGELNLTDVLGKYFKNNGISTILYTVEILVGINLMIIAIVLMIKIKKI